MRLKMIHIAAALATAVLLVIVFMATGILVVASMVAVLAAGLVAWIAYRVARNTLVRANQQRAVSQGRHGVVSRPPG